MLVMRGKSRTNHKTGGLKMSAIVGGVPICGWCLKTMRCVKNEVTLLIGDERPDHPVRGAYSCDLFECRECQDRVLIPALGKHQLEKDVIKHLRNSGEVVLDVNSGNGVYSRQPRTQEKK